MVTFRNSAVVVVVLALLVGACSSPAATRLHVSAAASLTDAFTSLAEAFEARNPDTEVALNLGGSATLVEQVVRGAPVDVLATADARTMQRAEDAGVVAPAVPFATNQLVVATGDDALRPRVEWLADRDLLVGLCAPQVPCGAAARTALTALGIQPEADTEDADVRTLLARLVAGELDVGVVYATDVAATDGELHATELPGATTTLVLATAAAAHPAAGDFVEFVQSEAGAAILREHGFGIVEEAP